MIGLGGITEKHLENLCRAYCKKPRIRFCNGYILRPAKVLMDEHHIDAWIYANKKPSLKLIRGIGWVYVDGTEAMRKLSTIAH